MREATKRKRPWSIVDRNNAEQKLVDHEHQLQEISGIVL